MGCLPPLLRVDIATSSDLDPPIALGPRPAEDTRQIILVHQVAVPRALFLLYFPGILLLVLGEDELLTPTILATTLDAGILAARRAVCGFGDAENIAAVVVLEVLLQVKLEVPLGVGAAGHTCESRLPT